MVNISHLVDIAGLFFKTFEQIFHPIVHGCWRNDNCLTFIYIFSVIDKTAHFFMCLFALCVSSAYESFHVSCPFFSWVGGLFLIHQLEPLLGLRILSHFFLKIFLMWTIYKVFIEFVTCCFCIILWFFGQEVCEILTPQLRIEPAPPALEGEALTSGPLGKSHESLF